MAVSAIITALVVSLLAVCFFVLGYYLTTGILPGARAVYIPSTPPLTDNKIGEKQAKFMYFYATWCPWSQKAQIPWASFKQLVQNQGLTYGGYSITFDDINGDTNKGMSSLYNVNAFPTFKLETSDKLYEMKGTPDILTFKEFLKATLGEEKVTQGSS
uniref:Thioredoxin domain-containing protein n=1 Tax=viral metagenome TaxID=1070528 RepID=A0A6C0CIP9_9ZZZZ